MGRSQPGAGGQRRISRPRHVAKPMIEALEVHQRSIDCGFWKDVADLSCTQPNGEVGTPASPRARGCTASASDGMALRARIARARCGKLDRLKKQRRETGRTQPAGRREVCASISTIWKPASGSPGARELCTAAHTSSWTCMAKSCRAAGIDTSNTEQRTLRIHGRKSNNRLRREVGVDAGLCQALRQCHWNEPHRRRPSSRYPIILRQGLPADPVQRPPGR